MRDRVTHLKTSVLANVGPGKANPDNGASRPRDCRVLLKFRKVAIAVLAANRLALLGRENRVTFVVQRDGISDGSTAVHIGEPLSGGVKLGAEVHSSHHPCGTFTWRVMSEVHSVVQFLMSGLTITTYTSVTTALALLPSPTSPHILRSV